MSDDLLFLGRTISTAIRLAIVGSLSFWSCTVPLLSAATVQETPNSLETSLKSQPRQQLAKKVLSKGDPARGSLLFHNPELTCIRCHQPTSESGQRLGPSIAEINNEMSIESLIESVLEPSATLSEGFQSETLVTADGKVLNGLIGHEETGDDGYIVLIDPDDDGKETKIPNEDIDERKANSVSAMPTGLVGALPDEQSFLDLIRYLVEIKRGGTEAELRLRPPESFFAVEPLPAYESRIDHVGLIQGLNPESFDRGEAIYSRYCARCHGTAEQEGSMPSALKFAEGAFKNGNDPYSMYQTLTHGYGLMVAQRWMVPRQKYDVIHYIREEFLRKQNPNQHAEINDQWLASLPVGNELGPDPVDQKPWSEMDYGNFLFNTYEVGDDGTNIAYKGIAIRLDQGPGGVSQGKQWVLYEHDTLRVAAIWSDPGFIDYNGIHFNDRHGIHPRIVGDLHIANDHRPGWANPQTDSFSDDPRVSGRDQRRYGPLPEAWLKYRGLYQYGDRVVLNYSVGDTDILESPDMQFLEDQTVFQRTLNLAARPQPLLVKVAKATDLAPPQAEGAGVILEAPGNPAKPATPVFDGSSFLESQKTFDWKRDLTVFAKVKTAKGGTIFCQTGDGKEWVAGGTSLFVRNGKLVFDIGWVGDVTSQTRIDDDQWHQVALVWQPKTGGVRLLIDGELDTEANLQPGDTFENPVVRIGFTAENFPRPTFFMGEIATVKVWDRGLSDAEIAELETTASIATPLADWDFSKSRSGNKVADPINNSHPLVWKSAANLKPQQTKNTWAVVQGIPNPEWSIQDDALCLRIPAGDNPLQLAIFSGADGNKQQAKEAMQAASQFMADKTPANLTTLTRGGPPAYPDVLESRIETMPVAETDAFAVDFLNRPEDNPWACRMRLTGIDFVNDDEALICAWDGSVWRVNGFLNGQTMQWRRVAHGMFQPLGIRIRNGEVFVTCRDQLVRLQDLNDDGYFDFYEAFNSDHQVTEHFHEFAMGLQSDEAGNFYYAKSARHALPALVPHHGTLLKVSADGRDTTIIANGFRAANGVCLNPDGSFFVTDQEGHWTPKNRINWVQGKGGFYGNMYGYHEVEDNADDAMQQPLCWITNRFDRSPGELLWVPERAWGPFGGSLLNLSYGMGQIFVVPHEDVSDSDQSLLQGGMCALPIPLFPTGVMRGRFHSDGQLYCCGMYAWAGNRQSPGGLYRVRYTGEPAWLPTALAITDNTLTIQLSDDLDPAMLGRDQFAITTWHIHRSANYGSDHLDSRDLAVESVELMDDGRTVKLTIPELQETRCMEIKLRITTPDGREINRVIHNTIHQVRPENASGGQD